MNTRSQAKKSILIPVVATKSQDSGTSVTVSAIKSPDVGNKFDQDYQIYKMTIKNQNKNRRLVQIYADSDEYYFERYYNSLN